MQSFIAFCSICLQLSKLENQALEFARSRDEACTLCLADVLHTTSNRSSHEILSDGLYFTNPLLHDALKLKMEHEFLIQSDDCLQQQVMQESEQVSKLARDQAEEALQSFAEKLSKLPSGKGEIKDGLVRQKNEISEMVQGKLYNVKNFYEDTFQRDVSMGKVPQHLQDMLPRLEKAGAEILERILPEQLEMKTRTFSEKLLKERQELNQKIEELKKKINLTQSPQDLQNIVQETKQAVDYLEEQYKLQYGIEHGSILSDFYRSIRDFFDELHGSLKSARTTLKVGEKMKVDERLSSENGIFSLIMESGFILTLYRFDEVIWRHQCRIDLENSLGSQELFLNQDGVLVIQDDKQQVREAFNIKDPSYSGDGAYLTITNAGEIKILDSERELWSPLYSSPASDVLNGIFSQKKFLVSENGVYTLLVTSECHLVLYEGSTLIWSKGLRPPSAKVVYCTLHLNNNGQLESKTHYQDRLPNLVLVRRSGTNDGHASLIVRNDGIVAIMGGDKIIWTSQKDSFD